MPARAERAAAAGVGVVGAGPQRVQVAVALQAHPVQHVPQLAVGRALLRAVHEGGDAELAATGEEDALDPAHGVTGDGVVWLGVG